MKKTFLKIICIVVSVLFVIPLFACGNCSPKEYTVVFNGYGGDVSFPTKTVRENEKIGEFPTAERSGYILVCWKYGETEVDENTVFTFGKDIELKAEWREDVRPKEFTVTFDGNGGTISFTTKTVR